MSAASILLLRL